MLDTVKPTGTPVEPTATPIVLREDLLPPQYGTSFTEGSSMSFYTKYLEYGKRVERANKGGAIQHQMVPMAELVPIPLQRVFARRYYKEFTITPQQLAAAIEKHAGYAAGAEEKKTQASATVARGDATEGPKSSRNRGSKSAGRAATIKCRRCGHAGHIARNCPSSSNGESWRSSAARPHRSHKGKGRRSGGDGAGRSSDGGGSWSSSQKQHQQQR